MVNTIDPYEKKLFDHVLQGEERDRHIRINIIGFFAEGKTTLTRRLLHESLEDSCGTDGIDVHVRRCKVKGKHWTICEALDLYEECSRRLVDAVDLECENVTREGEMDHQTTNGEYDFVREQIRNIICSESSQYIQNTPSSETSQITNGERYFQQDVLVREGTNQKIQEHISLDSSQYVQGTSSSEPSHSFIGIEGQYKKLKRLFSKHLRDIGDEADRCEFIANIWDFGGQFIYYATHQIFHTRDAIYLLCFDLTKDLDTMIIDCDFPDRKEMMKNSLLFWVNSIYASVGGEDKSSENPVIILVGTHRDKFHGDIDKKFDKVFDLFTKSELRNLIYYKPFAVASKDKNDYAVGELRNTIYELGLERSKARTLPTRWIPLEVAVLGDTEKNILQFKDIESMNTKMTFPLSGKQEIKLFLNYHHAKGTIVFFDEDVLNEYVITKPQFLVDAFKCIITAKWFCRWNKDVRNSWKKLTNEAVLEMSLLNEVWSEKTESNFIEYKDILLLFLERQRILAEIQRMDEVSGEITSLGKYMIPSMLTRDFDNGTLLDFVRSKRYSAVILGLEIGNEVLATVYDKVSAALLGKWPPLEYNGQILVFQNGGFFRLDLQHACMIRKTDVSIELMLVNLCPSVIPDSIICDRFRRYVEMAIAHRKIRSHSQEKTYYIKCNDIEHEGLGSHRFHYLHDITNSVNVCCPDNKSHPINVHEATALWFLEKMILPTEADAIRKATSEDKLVERIAKEFGTNWKVLGVQIGLSLEELGLIDTGNDKIIVNIVHMFKFWLKKYPDLNKYNCERKGTTDFDTKTFEGWDKFRNCFDF